MLSCIWKPASDMPPFLLFLQIAVLLWGLRTAGAQNSSLISQGRGWIVAGRNDPTFGDPSCSYCLNILGANYNIGFLGHNVSIFRCLKFDYNELWKHSNTTYELQVADSIGNVTCLEASKNADFTGRNISYLNNFFMAACDGSPQQQWFFDSGRGRIRSGLKSSGGEDLFMVQGQLPEGENPARQAGYNLYLSTDAGFNDSSDFMSSSFLYLPTTSYNIAAPEDWNSSPFGSDLVRNGGFETSTLLNQSNDFYDNELFSLCGWAIIKAPKLIPVDDWTPAQGNYSLLMSRASINQTIPTEVAADYLLSFSISGYLKRTYPFTSCSRGSLLDVTVVGSTAAPVASVFNASGQGWQVHTLRFKALSTSCTIIFKATALNDPCGPLIDDVKVVQVPSQSSSSKDVRAAVVTASACALVVLFAAPSLVLWRRRYYAKHLLRQQYGLDKVKLYSWTEIKKATKNFTTVIGQGGFSVVYKADFGDGIVGAAKVGKQKHKTSQFAEEVCLLQQIHYRNLVNLHGVCFGKGKHVLVFEYMENGSLYDRLHPATQQGTILPWGSRMKICYQVACALEYLHHHTTPPIVHRDIKSANILLTLANDAKLADFGLSKSAPTDALSFESIQTDVKGSLGYLDPKYVRSGVFSTRSDVYSYGVVLLEIITGHRAIKESDVLPVWAAPYLSNPAMASDMVDARLGGQYDSGDLAMLVELATMCLQDESEMRPSMQQVVSFYTERHLTSAPASHENEAQDVSIDMDSEDSSLDTTSPVRPLDSQSFTTFTSSLQFQGR